MIDTSLIFEGFLFATHRDRCIYIGQSFRDRPQWLKNNQEAWRRTETVQQKTPRLVSPASELRAEPAAPNNQTSSRRDRADADEENAQVDGVTRDLTPLRKPTLRSATPKSKARGPETDTTPLGPTPRERGRTRDRRLKKQKPSAESSKASRRLSPERMRIVLESLRNYPILSDAAQRAGMHRKTLRYWIRRSEAGDAGYDIKWQGRTCRFHEHCKSAKEEAHRKNKEALLDLARSNPNPKTQLLCLKTCRPETYDNKQGKPDPWRSGGVAIVGDCTKRDDRFAVSIEARKWKALTRKIQKMK